MLKAVEWCQAVYNKGWLPSNICTTSCIQQLNSQDKVVWDESVLWKTKTMKQSLQEVTARLLHIKISRQLVDNIMIATVKQVNFKFQDANSVSGKMTLNLTGNQLKLVVLRLFPARYLEFWLYSCSQSLQKYADCFHGNFSAKSPSYEKQTWKWREFLSLVLDSGHFHMGGLQTVESHLRRNNLCRK